MADKNEKARRKQLKNELRNKEQSEFEKNLPMSRELFGSLFNYLDTELSATDCDNTLKLTTNFLQKNHVTNIDTVENWLNENGGYCDCEVLANVEEKFEH